MDVEQPVPEKTKAAQEAPVPVASMDEQEQQALEILCRIDGEVKAAMADAETAAIDKARKALVAAGIPKAAGVLGQIAHAKTEDKGPLFAAATATLPFARLGGPLPPAAGAAC